MLASAAAGVANHLLEGQPWLRDRLLPFAGRTLEVHLPGMRWALTVGTDGRLAPPASGVQPDAIAVVAAPPALAALLAGGGLARAVALEGDGAFVAVVAGVLGELRWDAEEDLSRLVGDVAAHRLVGAGTGFLSWQRRTAANLAAMAAEFLTEERPVLASRAEVEPFVEEVDALREAVERLEQRIDRLPRR